MIKYTNFCLFSMLKLIGSRNALIFATHKYFQILYPFRNLLDIVQILSLTILESNKQHANILRMMENRIILAE